MHDKYFKLVEFTRVVEQCRDVDVDNYDHQRVFFFVEVFFSVCSESSYRNNSKFVEFSKPEQLVKVLVFNCTAFKFFRVRFNIRTSNALSVDLFIAIKKIYLLSFSAAKCKALRDQKLVNLPRISPTSYNKRALAWIL